ncbi:MAG: 2-oxo acid dehydrogenase subunit E2, partial [Chthoniobacterales bacterium]
SFGTWTCPVVIYAPYGAYLPGGSLWHSQANEAALAHFPGINVVIPSTPEDAAGLLWTAMHCEDPTFVLIPKHLLWAEHESKEPVRAVPLGVARKRHAGSDVTLVAWGNTVEKSLEALAQIGEHISIDLIDLRSIVPWDRAAIEESVRRTGRLVVVQEDSENCSVGQMIIAHIAAQPDLWSELVAPPILVSKENVMIGYNPIYEYAALPDVERIVSAIRRSTSSVERRQGAALSRSPRDKERGGLESAPPRAAGRSMQRSQPITIPIMGEGIRNAKIVALLKQSGDTVELDDPLCEVETDKAVYPIESSFAGVMGEWKTEVGAIVDIGQEIGTINVSEASWDDQLEAKAEISANGAEAAAPAPRAPAPAPSRQPAAIEPALTPTITRRLGRVVPANLQIDVRWVPIRKAREALKKAEGKDAASPSVMVAWAVVRAMEKHPPFRRIILEDDSIVEHDEFDLGIAVALENDRLATAVVTKANKRDWPDFVRRYNETVEETRRGRVDAVNAPIVISSLGAFGVRAAAPIVVPPSIGTLFVGSAHQELLGNGKKKETAEVITLSLTFDHRVVNGAGAASFVHTIKEQIENFQVPAGTGVA